MLRSKPKKQPPPVDNSVSDSTGQYDLRFVLWRQFCAQNNIPVDTLPSQLNDEQKERWEQMKQKRLRWEKVLFVVGQFAFLILHFLTRAPQNVRYALEAFAKSAKAPQA